MAGTPPVQPPHAYVVEYRPLDRCFPPACKIRTRDVDGYADKIQEDGDPGGYVEHGGGVQSEVFFERGVLLRSQETFEFDLPAAEHASELDLYFAAEHADESYEALVTISALAGASPPSTLETTVVQGRTGTYRSPKKAAGGRFERYGTHLRLVLPSRALRGLRISIANKGARKLAIGSPLVMRRVEGRAAKQGVFALFDAVPFHMMDAMLSRGTGDARADWVRKAVAERGYYFPDGQSMGQGTAHFIVRFFTGSYFAQEGWQTMYGKGFDETLPPVLPGPVARAADAGYVTHFSGNNFTLLPAFGHPGFDTGYHSELADHPLGMLRDTERWISEHPDDDSVFVWWNSATHAPWPPGRGGPPPPPIALGPDELWKDPIPKIWKNLLEGLDGLEDSYAAIRKASPKASRIVWLGADHSRGISKKMEQLAYRVPTTITTGLSHTCGGTSEESNVPFAILFDGPAREGRPPRVVHGRTSTFIPWRAFESVFGIELGFPRTSTFQSPAFPPADGRPIWDDKVMVSIGYTSTVRASRGELSYVSFTPKLSQTAVWGLRPNMQLVLAGGPTRSEGILEEQLFHDDGDPYELNDVAGKELETTLRFRRDVTDWMGAHYDEHHHPRHRNKLVFSAPTDLDVFAPRPFTAIGDDVPIASADGRLAHVHAKELVILEGAEPVGIIELQGVKGPLVLKCSSNGLPLDVLTPDRPRFNLNVARLNCPLREGAHDIAGPGEVLFSYEPASAQPEAPGAAPRRPATPGGGGGPSDELLAGMKRWGYVRDIDDKKK
ncbi:MAG: hypothetical protein JWP87_6155 [Labilithrix sp.]|nr:hypothetical protein [Labilithrix sp.]